MHRACAIRTGHLKLVNHSELYDLARDTAEATKIAAQHRKVVARMQRRFDDWWDEVLPAALQSDMTRGPEINPFKELYWEQFGGGPDDTLRQRMDPAGKFTPPPARR